MKVNKRIIGMLVGVLMIGSMAVGCEKKENKVEETQQQVQTQVTEESEQETKEEEVNKVVYDKDDIKITYTGMEYNKEYDATMINFKIENNRNEDVIVQNDSEVSINDITVNNSIVEELSSGQSVDTKLVFANEYDLKNNGIDEIEKFKTNLMILHNEYEVLVEDVLSFDISK